MIYRVGELRPQATRSRIYSPPETSVRGFAGAEPVFGRMDRCSAAPARRVPADRTTNRPITKDAPQPEKIWSGRIRFDRDTVIRTPVRITAGTEIRLDPGISLVFRRKLTAIGTTEAPITILRTSDDASLSGPWGTIALQGAGTRGSRLRHMKISVDPGTTSRPFRILACCRSTRHPTSFRRFASRAESNRGRHATPRLC